MERELAYLRELHQRYHHYFKQYFGFSLQDIARYMGISKPALTLILQGKRGLLPKRKEKFLEAYRMLDIENKTKDFQETGYQKTNREFNKKIRLTRI